MTTRASRIPAKFAETTKELQRLVEGNEPVRLEIPYPPTLNHRLMPAGGRNILSPEYRKWFKHAEAEAMMQKPRLLRGRVGIYVDVSPPDKRIRDLDNISTKGIIDLLVKLGVIEGDDSRYVRLILARWVDTGTPCVVTIKKMLE